MHSEFLFRFFVAFSVSGVFECGFVLVTEIVSAELRTPFGIMTQEGFFPLTKCQNSFSPLVKYECHFLKRKMISCHKPWFSNLYIYSIPMSDGSNSISLQYHRMQLFSLYKDLVLIWINSCHKIRLFNHISMQPELKEFEPRLKFETRFKYSWFHRKMYSMFQDLSRRSIETGFWPI